MCPGEFAGCPAQQSVADDVCGPVLGGGVLSDGLVRALHNDCQFRYRQRPAVDPRIIKTADQKVGRHGQIASSAQEKPAGAAGLDLARSAGGGHYSGVQVDGLCLAVVGGRDVVPLSIEEGGGAVGGAGGPFRRGAGRLETELLVGPVVVEGERVDVGPAPHDDARPVRVTEVGVRPDPGGQRHGVADVEDVAAAAVDVVPVAVEKHSASQYPFGAQRRAALQSTVVSVA